MKTEAPSRPRRRVPPFLLPLLVAVQLFTVAVRHTPFELRAVEHAYFAVLYVFLGWLAVAVARFGRGLGRVPGALGALLVGCVLAIQLRLDGEQLAGLATFGAAVLAFSLVVGFLLRLEAPAERGAGFRPVRALGALVVPAVGFLALAAWGFARTDSIRWHLLNHNRLVGLPAYYLGSTPIRTVRQELWSSRPRLVEPWERAEEALERRARGGKGAPNVVVLLVDTLRADALAAHGGDPSLMPNLNALAARGVVFRDVLANASWTRASVASLFTGLLPEEHGAVRFHDSLSPAWTTMPEALRAAGYQTAGFVTNWVQVGVETGFDQGFDVFVEMMGDENRGARASYARAEKLHATALAWLAGEERAAAAAEGRPLFLYLHYLDPHSPYLSGPEPGLEGDVRERKRGAYRQELRYLDAELGELFEALEEALPGPTAIVLTSDHGEEFWEHGEWGHGHTLYRELTWVPAVLALPGRSVGVSIDEALELRDLFDLVLALAEPGPEGGWDAVAWARERARAERYASQFLDRATDVRPDKKHTALRRVERDGHALVWSGFGPTWELYDLEGDPAERANVIDAEGERGRGLRERLDGCVRFWASPPRVQRSEDALRFLQALGYAGGAREEDTH